VPDVPGAVRYCVRTEVGFAGPCNGGGGEPFENECCEDSDCDGGDSPGYCYAFQFNYCGGAAPPDVNVCRYDECQSNADCQAGQACAPRGFAGLDRNRCITALCNTDADCDTRAGGQCTPLGGPNACAAFNGFYCTYDDDVCRSSADCPAEGFGIPVCGWDAGAARVECRDMPIPP
jgi:hypothetical protein